LALGQHRSTQRKVPHGREDEERLTADIIELARQYGRYGYRKVAELLRQVGWTINDKRVERIWQREGLKVPHKQPNRVRYRHHDESIFLYAFDLIELNATICGLIHLRAARPR
jgi:putative transposase